MKRAELREKDELQLQICQTGGTGRPLSTSSHGSQVKLKNYVKVLMPPLVQFLYLYINIYTYAYI